MGTMAEEANVLAAAWRFVRSEAWRIAAVSILMVVPCVWQRHIEAGDLGSHVYNAWLAQLIARGQAPGLYIATRWNNVLFDVALLKGANLVGFGAVEKIVVGACVLIFFWGVFAWISAVSGNPPWFLSPGIAILAYGYCFNMGFMNYYLSMGLACLGMALGWRGRGVGNWCGVVLIAALTLLAHPIGFLWLCGTLLYGKVRDLLGTRWKWIPAFVTLAGFAGTKWYLLHKQGLEIDWTSVPFYFLNGADQLAIYGERYSALVGSTLVFIVVCLSAEILAQRKHLVALGRLILPVEFYLVTFVAITLLPENVRFAGNPAWMGLLVSRLTVIAAIFGLCILGRMEPRKWHLVGCLLIAGVFFIFLYEDTLRLNHTEINAEKLLSKLPAGSLIIPRIDAPPDWRVEFVGHLADRACIDHCFAYSNYEAPTQQFRVRVAQQGSPLVTSSEDDAESMAGGTYEIQENDPPLKLLYQCDQSDLSKLCLHDLVKGETTGGLRSQPSQ